MAAQLAPGTLSEVASQIVAATTAPNRLQHEAEHVFRERWPEFIFHDPTPALYRDRINAYFSDYDILLVQEGRVVAGGWGVPLPWNGKTAALPDGYNGALVASVEACEQRRPPNTLSIMAAVVAADRQGRALSVEVLKALIELAIKANLTRVIAPVRPTAKHEHPELTVGDYAARTGADGFSVDPWIRIHQQMGASILGPALNSMVIHGTVAHAGQRHQPQSSPGLVAQPEPVNPRHDSDHSWIAATPMAYPAMCGRTRAVAGSIRPPAIETSLATEPHRLAFAVRGPLQRRPKGPRWTRGQRRQRATAPTSLLASARRSPSSQGCLAITT